MPETIAEYSDRDEAFAAILQAARKGECLSYKSTDARGAYIVEAESWNRHCLGYPAVKGLQLSSDAERLGASVFRYICLYARDGYRHVRTEWVRGLSNAGEMKEFGISVSQFSDVSSPRRRGGRRKRAPSRTNLAEQWLAMGILLP